MPSWLTGTAITESGAFTHLTADTDLSLAALYDILTDRQTKTRALHEFVEFDETLEDGILLFLWDTAAGVLAIEVKSRFLLTVQLSCLLPVTDTDMSFCGVFHCIRDEISDNLLDTSLIQDSDKFLIGIILDESHVGIVHTLLQGLAHQVKLLGKVNLLRNDLHQGVRDIGSLKDVVDES